MADQLLTITVDADMPGIERRLQEMVAGELVRLAGIFGQRGVARQQIGMDDGDECVDGCELNGCHAMAAADAWYSAEAVLKGRAADLREVSGG